MPEPAKTRQPRQRTSPAEQEAAIPETASDDVAQPEPLVADEAVEADEVAETGAGAVMDDAEELADEPSDEAETADWAVEADSIAKPGTAAAKPATSTPAADKRQLEREFKAAEKRRIEAEKQRRKADFTAARTRQQEADRVQLWAERRQAEADKARVAAEKAAARAAAAREAAGDDPTPAATRRVEAAEQHETHTRELFERTQAEADALRKRARKSGVHSTKSAGKVANPGSRQWVPPTFITVGLLGVVWLVIYYITASTGIYVPGMSDLGGWNVVIGMGLMASAFGIATLWK